MTPAERSERRARNLAEIVRLAQEVREDDAAIADVRPAGPPRVLRYPDDRIEYDPVNLWRELALVMGAVLHDPADSGLGRELELRAVDRALAVVRAGRVLDHPKRGEGAAAALRHLADRWNIDGRRADADAATALAGMLVGARSLVA